VTLLSCVRGSYGTFVGAGHAPPAARNRHAQLHQNIKLLCYPVGANLCVGPLRTCRFRARAHTQVRPYKVDMIALTDHASEPGHLHVPRQSYMQFETPSSKFCAALPRSPGCRGTTPALAGILPGRDCGRACRCCAAGLRSGCASIRQYSR